MRLQALRLLVGGQYTATWEAWRRHAESESLLELPAVDKRALFHAMRATSGDAAVPYFRDLLSEKGWRQRKQREETALVAIDVLVMLGSPKAADALELGKQSGNSAVRQACAAALAGLARRGSGKGS